MRGLYLCWSERECAKNLRLGESKTKSKRESMGEIATLWDQREDSSIFLLPVGFVLDEESMQFLEEKAISSPNLTMLSLARCQDVMLHLRSSSLFGFSNLLSLDLRSNFLGDEGVAVLLPLLASTSCCLEDLFLNDNSIGEPGATALGQWMRRNKNLLRLNLSQNAIGADGLEHIMVALEANEKNKLHTLLLSYGNNVGDAGAERLSKFFLLEHCKLKSVSLASNNIGIAGSGCLGAALASNVSLEMLGLAGNSIGDHGVAFLIDGLGANCMLKKLFLNGNGITDTGLQCLGVGLAQNHKLTELWIGSNVFTESDNFIAALLKNNSLLKVEGIDQSGPVLKFLLDRNSDAAMHVKRAALNLIAIRKYHAEDGVLGSVPKDVVLMIAKRLLSTQGQKCWLHL